MRFGHASVLNGVLYNPRLMPPLNLRIYGEIRNVYAMTVVVVTTRKCGLVMFSVASLCVPVCLSVCDALTFESLELESLFLVCRHSFGISRPNLHIRVTGSRSRSQVKKRVCVSCSRVDCLRLKDNCVVVVVVVASCL